jgi:hypothetical protein
MHIGMVAATFSPTYLWRLFHAVKNFIIRRNPGAYFTPRLAIAPADERAGAGVYEMMEEELGMVAEK